MEKEMVGVTFMSRFVIPRSSVFQKYMDYIDREEAVRNDNWMQYSAYTDFYMDNPEKQPVSLQPERTSALFTSTLDSLSPEQKRALKERFQLAQKNQSPMWQNVISFDNRFLQEYGIYDSKTGMVDINRLREITRASMDVFLKKEKMQGAVWSAAVHYNTDNLHVHIAVVEPHPSRPKMANGEYRGKIKLSSIDAAKSCVVNRIADQSLQLNQINQIIRENMISGAIPQIHNDRKLERQYRKIFQQLPHDRRLWKYNMTAMTHLRPEIDRLSSLYLNTYCQKDMQRLDKLLQRQADFWKKAYGSGEKQAGRYQQYKETKMKDLYTRLGNSILRTMREESSEESSNVTKRVVPRRSSMQTKSPIFDLKRALRREVNYTNQQVYEQLMQDINRAASQEKQDVWEDINL